MFSNQLKPSILTTPFYPIFSTQISFLQGRYNNTAAAATEVLVCEPFASEVFEYVPDLVETAKGRYSFGGVDCHNLGNLRV